MNRYRVLRRCPQAAQVSPRAAGAWPSGAGCASFAQPRARGWGSGGGTHGKVEVYIVKKIEVLGLGCPKCQLTLRNAEQAVKEEGIVAEVVKVTDMGTILARGVIMTPALAVDGKVVVSGHVPSVGEVKQCLTGM